MKEYEKFLGEECIQFKDKFEAFNQDKDRLDEFLGVFLRGKKQYKSLWKVCVIVFVLTHGQSNVERGYSVNKEMLVENLEKESLINQRLVYDAINAEK